MAWFTHKCCLIVSRIKWLLTLTISQKILVNLWVDLFDGSKKICFLVLSEFRKKGTWTIDQNHRESIIRWYRCISNTISVFEFSVGKVKAGEIGVASKSTGIPLLMLLD